MPQQLQRLDDPEIVLRIRCGENIRGGTDYDLVPAAEYWHEALNEEHFKCTLKATSRSCDKKRFMYALCKLHVLYKTVKVVVTNMENSRSGYFGVQLDCRICKLYNHPRPRRQKAPSAGEEVVYSCLASLGYGPDDFVIEAKVFGCLVSSCDVWLHRKKIVIMVDGPHHFVEVREADPLRQMQRDRSFNQAALLADNSVIRLHHEDQSQYRALLDQLIAECQDSASPVVKFSPAFNMHA